MTVHFADDMVTLHAGDALQVLRTLPDASVDCCVTSPPYYGLRDYGTPGQYGLEPSLSEYVEHLRVVFAEVHRVLADDGTLWLNLGDTYAHPPGSAGRQGSGQRADRRFTAEGQPGTTELPAKNLMMVPERVALALQDDGWIIRNKIAWSKPNAMPESVRDRLSCRWEHVFLLVKQPSYWFDLDAIREPLRRPEALGDGIVFGGRKGAVGKVGASGRRSGGHLSVYAEGDAAARGRNPGDVWAIATTPYPDAHFATFPIALPTRCIKAGCTPRRCTVCGHAPRMLTEAGDLVSSSGDTNDLKPTQRQAGTSDCGHDAYRPGVVLDPFAGSGTTLEAARRLGRRGIGIDLNPAYLDLAVKRMAQGVLSFGAEAAS